MTSTTEAATITGYTYDGDGKRTRAATGTAAADVTSYAWDPLGSNAEVAVERDGAGSIRARYTYGQGRISQTAGGATSYYHPDDLGSVLKVTSSTGTPQWTYDYGPYGETTAVIQNDPAAPPNPNRYTGESLDPTGLYHLRARQYDPGTGRFTGRDPLGPPKTNPVESTYVYVSNRPTVLVDPSGKRGIKNSLSSTSGSSAIYAPLIGAGDCPSYNSPLNLNIPGKNKSSTDSLYADHMQTTTMCHERSTAYIPTIGGALTTIQVDGIRLSEPSSGGEGGGDENGGSEGEPSSPPKAEDINLDNLKTVDPRRVEQQTGLNPEDIKREYVGTGVSFFDLKRDTASGYLIIVEKRTQTVAYVTYFRMVSG